MEKLSAEALQRKAEIEALQVEKEKKQKEVNWPFRNGQMMPLQCLLKPYNVCCVASLNIVCRVHVRLRGQKKRNCSKSWMSYISKRRNWREMKKGLQGRKRNFKTSIVGVKKNCRSWRR